MADADEQAPPAQEPAHSGVRDTNDAKTRFLQAFSEIGFIKSACAKAAVGRRTIYEWTKSDPEFAKVLQELRDDWADEVEAEVYRRGVTGWDEPQFGRIARDRDGIVGTVRKHSDRLLELLAKANRPEKFRERFELTGKDGGPIETHELSESERADRIAAVFDAARARRDRQTAEGADKVGTSAGTPDPGSTDSGV